VLSMFRMDGEALLDADQFEDGVWVNLTAPTERELERVGEGLHLEMDFLKAALDDEEMARIEWDAGQTLVLVDLPMVEADGDAFIYTTLPLGIVMTDEAIVTVCLKDSPVVQDFVCGRVKEFYTYKKTRFILQLLYRIAGKYLQYLRQIDRASVRVQKELENSMRNRELLQLLALEKSLVYFSTSLKANEIVMEKLMRMAAIKKYPDDADLLEDVIIENKQAIEMCAIYRDILSGTMEAFSSVISNHLNVVMKFLTSVTIVISVPTIIASLWGMNVPGLPFAQNPWGFAIVCVLSVVISCVVALIMAKRKLL
jgi:magnesium transporter